MSSFVGRFHRGFGSLGTESLSADCFWLSALFFRLGVAIH
jgi:hypothetical protein